MHNSTSIWLRTCWKVLHHLMTIQQLKSQTNGAVVGQSAFTWHDCTWQELLPGGLHGCAPPAFGGDIEPSRLAD